MCWNHSWNTYASPSIHPLGCTVYMWAHWKKLHWESLCIQPLCKSFQMMNAGNLTPDSIQPNIMVHLPEWPLAHRDTDIPLIFLKVLQGRIKINVTNLLSYVGQRNVICKFMYLTQPPMVLSLVGHYMKCAVGLLQKTKHSTMKRSPIQQLRSSSKQFHGYNCQTYWISSFPKLIHIW